MMNAAIMSNKISCLTVTQSGRIGQLKNAICDFVAQTDVPKELVLVHDGGGQFHDQLIELTSCIPKNQVVLVHVPSGLTLGELRNISVQHATGEILCQWDDDDRNHPLRLSRQLEAMLKSHSSACFLQDQLHYFSSDRKLFWTDWQKDLFPLDVVAGTLMIQRACMPSYASLRVGEDSRLCHSLLNNDIKTHRIQGLGWASVYQYHGSNTWSYQHHLDIANNKAFNRARLLGKSHALQQRLTEYVPPICDGALAWALRDNSFIAVSSA